MEQNAGTTFAAIDKLMELRTAVEKRIEAVANEAIDGEAFAGTRTECSALLRLFDKEFANVKGDAVRVEQMKGVTKGFELAAASLSQQHIFYREQYSAVEEREQLRLCLDVLNRATGITRENLETNKREQARLAGRFEGSLNTIMAAAREVEERVVRYETQKEKLAGVVGEDEVGKMMEASYEKKATDKGNGVPEDKASKRKRPAAKKTPAKKTKEPAKNKR